ncbi:MAG: nucleoside triphosphate pyrophosphatase [Bryobacteraceae bacterium]
MLVLASRSPRRSELLRRAGIPFVVRVPCEVDESPRPHEKPERYVRRLAEAKALAVAAGDGEIILGADTAVCIGGHILGKPEDNAGARRMLALLSGRRHEVITGICLRFPSRVVTDWATTHVWFTELSDADIDEYIASGEPEDKAGAYAIQGLASKYVERIDGDYSNVVGLPVALVWKHLRA